MTRPGHVRPPVGDRHPAASTTTGNVADSRAIVPVTAAEGNVAVMRANAWKAALVAIVFCYPVASLIGRLITYIGLKVQSNPTSSDQLQMVNIGHTFFRIIAVLGWLIAFIGSMEATRAEDHLEKQLGRFSFVVVLVVTVIYIIAFFLGQGVDGFHFQ